jgi:hypothetical protein
MSTTTQTMRRTAGFVLLAALLPLAAHGATYRCPDAKGRTTLQDFPCETSSREGGAGVAPAGQTGTPSRPTAAATAGGAPVNTGDYASTRGAWRGPAQFHVMAGGQRDLQAHRIAPLVIELAADGKVNGVISEAGCKISGLTTQFMLPTLANIDVTLKGCADSRFNTRMSGTLSANSGTREGKLHLSSVGYTRTMKVEQLTIEAVLRR